MPPTRPVPEGEREPEQAIAESASPAQAPPLRLNSAAGVLALQRAVGNRAVQAMLAREDDEETTTATAPAKTDEQLFDDAVKANDWAKAAELIVKLPKSIDKMSALSADQMYKLADAASVDQLRLLPDAAIRQGGWTGGLAQFAIRGKLVAKGVGAAKSAAGGWTRTRRRSSPTPRGRTTTSTARIPSRRTSRARAPRSRRRASPRRGCSPCRCGPRRSDRACTSSRSGQSRSRSPPRRGSPAGRPGGGRSRRRRSR